LKCIRNLRNAIWLCFTAFTLSILALLWFSFVVSLESNYRSRKTRDIVGIANYIITYWGSDSFSTENLNKIAYENDMCVLIRDNYDYVVYSYDMAPGNCLIHSVFTPYLASYQQQAKDSPNGFYYVEVMNARISTNTLLFVMVLGNREAPSGYVYLNTPLEPLESTVAIIKSQILRISVLLFALGLVISYFLAGLVEGPILRLTRSAKQLGTGDLTARFDGRGYSETETLAAALNYAAAEMSKADSLRRDLIANIPHDLRTPLTMVKAYAEMIRDLSWDNPVKRDEHLNIIIEESDRLSALIDDILSLSKLESGNFELSRRTFDISEKISGIMGRYRLFSEQFGYGFTLELDGPFFVDADPLKIEQVLYNLIDNAINYTGEDKMVRIAQKNGKNSVLVEISDTGDGIEPDLIPLIFDRYYRAEKSRREVIGTGLGLSIVKAILKQHGYKFGVCSEKGRGSTFWFEMESTPSV